MALNLNSLPVNGGNRGGQQGVIYNYFQNPPPSIIVSQVQHSIIFFYDNEAPSNGSIALKDTTTALNNYNGNFHFLTAIPISPATGNGSVYDLIVGKNLSSNGQKEINCANLKLSFSKNGTETPVSIGNFVDRNCSAIPNNETYLFQPFQIPNLNNAFNTVTISVQSGQNGGIENDVFVFIYGDAPSLASPLIGIIEKKGDSFTFKSDTKGNLYLMAFIQPSSSLNGRKLVVNFSTGDPKIDSKITFDDVEVETKEDSVAPTELETGSKNKGCLSVFGLW